MIKSVRLYFARHGHVSYFDDEQRPVNPKYAPLSDRGRGQIRQLSKQFAEEEIHFDHIYSSTMPRAIETAKLIAKYQRHQTLIELDALREIKAGRLVEIPHDQAERIIHYAYHQKSQQLTHFLNGESWQAFQSRVIPCIEQLIHQHVDQKIFIAAHDVVNRLILAWAHDQLDQDLHAQEQHYGALNIIDIYIADDRIVEKRVLLQNYTPYNLFKKDLHHNAVEDIYQMYLKTNGFQEKLA